VPKPLEITQSVSIITVFLQGLVTFLSPCVLPLLPMYFGYLAGGTYTVNEDGTIEYPRKRVFVNTLFFVLGIAATFFVLALGATAAGQFFKDQGIDARSSSSAVSSSSCSDCTNSAFSAARSSSSASVVCRYTLIAGR
jgi:cytochrome c biogenesis protein CcdA